MKNKILIPGIILGVLAIFFSFKYYKQGPTLQDGSTTQQEQQTILRTVMTLIDRGHYSPKTIDDNFSAVVFDKTIERLDGEKKFFTQADYDSLRAKYRHQIDDEIKADKLTFFDEVNELFKQRVNEMANLYPKLLEKPFDLNKADSMQLDPKKMVWAKNETELETKWRNSLKYRALVKYIDLKESEDKKAKDTAGYKVKSYAQLEKEAREYVGKIQERYFKRMKTLSDNDRFSLFMNCITYSEDPHTDFFPPEQKQQFDEMMSGSFFGIGAALQQTEDGTIKITEIITGSPAWKQGKLKAKDVILKVAAPGEQAVDVEGMELKDVVKMIRGPKGTPVNLTVKHADGTNEVIKIIRGKVELDYLFAKSAVIKDGGKKIGYIYLPEFYADFNGTSNRRSADDVKKEVIKLQNAGVDGIILDLRDNGGGSLADVVDMAGIFVGSGPVVQVKSRGERTAQALNNQQGAPIYTGPLAVMVNGNSASASEIMAAAMQDYHRAVIIGSNTFGKGTVQRLISLDQFVSPSIRNQIIQALNAADSGKTEYEGIGSLKLTIQKFYRINGGSTQLKGVTPDIILPNATDLLEDDGERSESSALPWDMIAPLDFSLWTSLPPLEQLKADSRKRVDQSAAFSFVKETAKTLKYRQDHNFIPLSIKGYNADQAKSKALNKKLDQLDSIGKKMEIANLAVDLETINRDTSSIEKNKNWLKGLQKDIYLNEAVNVLGDWNRLSGKNIKATGKK